MSCVSTCLPLGIIHLYPLIPPCTLLPSPATPLAPCHPPYSAQSSTGWGCSMAFPGHPKSCCEPADPGTAQPCWVWSGGGSRWSVGGCTGAGSRQFGRAPSLVQAWPQPRAVCWGDPVSPAMTPSSSRHAHGTGLYLSACTLRGCGMLGEANARAVPCRAMPSIHVHPCP